MVNCTFNTTPTERLLQHPPLFTTNSTDRTSFLWRFHTTQPSHPGHSTILLQSESLSGKCAKLHTVVASNNRDHMPWSLYYNLFVPHIHGCHSSRTPRSWWIAHSTQRQRRGCYNILSFLQRTALIARPFCEGFTRHDLHILVTAPFCCNRKAWAASAQSF